MANLCPWEEVPVPFEWGAIVIFNPARNKILIVQSSNLWDSHYTDLSHTDLTNECRILKADVSGICKFCYDCFAEHSETLQTLITAGVSDTVWGDYKCVNMVSTNFL